MIEVYTKDYCPYCHHARALLDSKTAVWMEYDVTRNPTLESQMRERSGRRTVPQIFINDTHIGGADDLFALEHAGKLDPLLASLRLPEETPIGDNQHEAL